MSHKSSVDFQISFNENECYTNKLKNKHEDDNKHLFSLWMNNLLFWI